jgi:hypothetical protein
MINTPPRVYSRKKYVTCKINMMRWTRWWPTKKWKWRRELGWLSTMSCIRVYRRDCDTGGWGEPTNFKRAQEDDPMRRLISDLSAWCFSFSWKFGAIVSRIHDSRPCACRCLNVAISTARPTINLPYYLFLMGEYHFHSFPLIPSRHILRSNASNGVANCFSRPHQSNLNWLLHAWCL